MAEKFVHVNALSRFWTGIKAYLLANYDRPKLNADVTYYVNSSTGNNNNSGLSSGASKLTVQAVIDLLPKNLGLKNVYIMCTGTFAGSFTLQGFYNGQVRIDGGTHTSSNYVRDCPGTTDFYNFTMNTVGQTLYFYDSNSMMTDSICKNLILVNSTIDSIYLQSNGTINIGVGSALYGDTDSRFTGAIVGYGMLLAPAVCGAPLGTGFYGIYHPGVKTGLLPPRYIAVTAGSNGDFYVTLPRTLATNDLVYISFPAATNGASSARLSIDGGTTYKNIRMALPNGTVSYNVLASAVASSVKEFRYDGTYFQPLKESSMYIPITLTIQGVCTSIFAGGARYYPAERKVVIQVIVDASGYTLNTSHPILLYDAAYTPPFAIPLATINSGVVAHTSAYTEGVSIYFSTSVTNARWYMHGDYYI